MLIEISKKEMDKSIELYIEEEMTGEELEKFLKKIIKMASNFDGFSMISIKEIVDKFVKKELKDYGETQNDYGFTDLEK